MNYKKILLFVVSCLIIILYFSTNFYGNWLHTRIMNSVTPSDFPNEIDHLDFQLDHMGIEQRREARWGSTYSFCKNVSKYLEQQHAKDPLLLLPPAEYLKAHQVSLLSLEPIVVYYFCGIKCAQITSKNLDKVDWAILVEGYGNNGEVTIERISNKKQLDDIIAEYKNPNKH